MKGEEMSSRGRGYSDAETINRNRKALFRALNATDLDALLAPLADDIVLMNHGGPPPVVGKRSVRSAYEVFFRETTPNLSHSSNEVVVSGDWAFDWGTWVSIKSDKRGVPQERLESCYAMIWRRGPEGAWKLARFIWNGADVPLRARKAGESGMRPRGKRRN